MNFRNRLVMSPDAMYELIASEVQDAHHRYEHVVLEQFPSIHSFDCPIIMGSFGWTIPKTRQRLIHTKHALYIEGLVCTPADLARHYLSIKYPDMLRCRTSQYKAFSQRRYYPLYAKPCLLDCAAYIDIQSAYWSILQVLGWDVEYKPILNGKRGFFGVGQSMADWPFPDQKVARNCLVSIGIGKGIRQYHRGRFKVLKTGNPHANRGLWACIMDILNSIAYEAVLAGAVYVNTDGYIFDISKLDEGMSVVEKWGLPVRIKHMGQCRVWGTGAYDINGHWSKRPIRNPNEVYSIRPVENIDWLREQVQFHARRTLVPIEEQCYTRSELRFMLENSVG